MPWNVRKHGNEFCVYDKNGKIIKGGCHPTKSEAEQHKRALYANVEDVQKELGVYVLKGDDDAYDIISISTVAREDKEGETFTIEAMDFDAKLAAKSKDYPEYRMFHKKSLGIGKVSKMHRIGNYAIEEGKSYTDPFSLAVCEKMLLNNDGKWKNSRGFYVLEATGGCPVCKNVLKVSYKHMVAGFYCPVCKSLQTDFRGELLNTRFTKTRTFDITITDRPAVPWTATIAYNKDTGDADMTKTQLRKKMLAAGIDEAVIEERLNEIDGDVLKELGNDLPFAKVLKEAGMDDLVDEEEEEEEEEDEKDKKVVKEEFTMDDEVIDLISEKVSTRIKEHLEGASFDVSGLDELAVEMKEVDEITEKLEELSEQIVALKEAIETLSEHEDVRITRKLKETPRNGKLRIIRRAKEYDEDEDEDMMEEEEDEEMPMKKGKQMPAFRTFGQTRQKRDGLIADGDGKVYSSMTDMVVNK